MIEHEYFVALFFPLMVANTIYLQVALFRPNFALKKNLKKKCRVKKAISKNKIVF